MAPPDEAKYLEALKTLEVPDDREGLTRKFLRDRTLFGERTGGELMRRSSLDILVDVSGSFDDFSRGSDALDANSFKRFISGFSDDFGLSRDNLEQNREFREAFLKLREMELNVKNRRIVRDKYFELKRKVSRNLVGYVGENSENAERFYNGYIKLEKDRHVTGKIFALAKNGDSRLVKMVEDWRNERTKLDEEYKKGTISQEEYLAKRDVINEKAVKESGDQELRETWSLFRQDEAYADAQEVIPDDPNEKPVTNKDQVQAAFAEINSHGLPIDFHDDGSVSLVLGDEKFPVDVSVFRNQKSGELVFYIVDSYSDNGIVKVGSDESLMDALDQRYIDAYLSNKIGAIPGETDSPFDVSDEDLINLCERLIGKGDKRGYKLKDEDKEVLDNLVFVLISKDDKYPGIDEKIKALIGFIKTKDDGAFIRQKLLASDVLSFEDLISRLD